MRRWEAELAAVYEIEGVGVTIRSVFHHPNGVLALARVRLPQYDVYGLRLRPDSFRPKTNPWKSQGIHFGPEILPQLGMAFNDAAADEKRRT